MSEKIYRVKLNSSGMPNFSTAVEVADRPQGEWICHKGRWIDFDYYPTKYECNQCHHYVDVASDKNFCPNCGAKMDGEREGE